tara:strand:- start:219 stop:518 length:300 start_codon:yes stop_codon:yes gene_type:complete
MSKSKTKENGIYSGFMSFFIGLSIYLFGWFTSPPIGSVVKSTLRYRSQVRSSHIDYHYEFWDKFFDLLHPWGIFFLFSIIFSLVCFNGHYRDHYMYKNK